MAAGAAAINRRGCGGCMGGRIRDEVTEMENYCCRDDDLYRTGPAHTERLISHEAQQMNKEPLSLINRGPRPLTQRQNLKNRAEL